MRILQIELVPFCQSIFNYNLLNPKQAEYLRKEIQQAMLDKQKAKTTFEVEMKELYITLEKYKVIVGDSLVTTFMWYTYYDTLLGKYK